MKKLSAACMILGLSLFAGGCSNDQIDDHIISLQDKISDAADSVSAQQETAMPTLQTETPELAAQDPEAPPVQATEAEENSTNADRSADAVSSCRFHAASTLGRSTVSRCCGVWAVNTASSSTPAARRSAS